MRVSGTAAGALSDGNGGGAGGHLEAARDSVVAARGLDPLYQQALTAATRSYCRIT